MAYDRVRSRVLPTTRRKGVMTIGKVYPWNTNTNSWHPSPNQVIDFDFDLPYVIGELCADELHAGPPYHEGGPFKSLKINRMAPYELQGVGTYYRQSDSSPSYWQKYVGGFSPPSVSTMGGVDVSNINNVLTLGSTLFPVTTGFYDRAWSSTKPRLEKASLFVFLAEMRDMPRMLRTTASGFHDVWKSMGGNASKEMMQPKKIANQFLNKEFGWAPFIGDIKRLQAAYFASAKYIKHLSLINGKPTRRRSLLVDTKTEVRMASGTQCIITPALDSHFFSTTPTWEVVEEVQTLVTASGKYSFYRPEFDTSLNEFNSLWNQMQRNLMLYGLRISPSNVYRATPWTWLIDWFSNVGDHVDLITDMSVDSVVNHYLYLSHRRQTVRKFRQILPFRQTGTMTLEWQKVIDAKQRVESGSPYGFSLSWDDLTPRQLAILAALKLSRQRWSGN